MTPQADEARTADRFRVLFEHSSDAHFIFDETGITDCNAATIQLLKATDKSQVLALHPAVLSPEYQPDGRRSIEKSKEMDGIARAQGYHRFEWLHRKLDGEVFPVEVTLNAVHIGGKPALIVVWHDLTEIKRAEAELSRRAEELAAINAHLKRDLQAAARVQQALLPAALPDTTPVRLAWTYRPCEELAGDLLNIFLLDDRRVGLYLLDVSGHGVTASLLSVTASHFLTPHGDASLLRLSSVAGTPAGLARPGEVVRRLNAQFCSERSEQFMTLFYGILDFTALRLCYANAGHPGPVVLSDGAAPRVLQENSALPVGVMEQAEYEDAELVLRSGDRFWLYSDGLPEAMTQTGEQFGTERLLAEFQACSSEALSDAVRRVLRAVESWAGESGPQDDISLVAFEIDRS
jgi:sigma-B regulation protein RsbU (phosphoserine phosphatase)